MAFTDKKPEAGQFLSTDAESLLNAPSECRDDVLPLAYLAHRLCMEPNAVLMPSTRTVGLRALSYYDPPTGKESGKPVRFGDFPCAVFGQIDADGRTHAHRIYVGPGGAGKAELGNRGDGKPRDAKKSARVIRDESTAGRAVIWGDPGRATLCILTEGIETAAAVAQAFRPQIESGTTCVAAAISATGMEAFKPWPGTKSVLVAADRDEAAKPGRAEPSRRGEQAATRFCIRNHGRAIVGYALAGEPATATDWLDVYLVRGPDAVIAGLYAAPYFVPTPEAIEEERQRKAEVDELTQIKRDYPLPQLEGFSLTYRRTRNGQIWVHKLVKTADGSPIPIPIATPFGVTARLRFFDQADAYGLRVVVRDMGGERREIDVDRAGFARLAACDTRATLYGAGLRTEDDGEHVVVKALKAANPPSEIALVRRPGWHTLDDGARIFGLLPVSRTPGLGVMVRPEVIYAASQVRA